MGMTKLLEINDLRTNFYQGKVPVPAIRGVRLHVNKGEILGIVGESGSGKSILMKSVMGILPRGAKIDHGEILLNGASLQGLNEKAFNQIRGHKMAMIFQDPMTALNPLKTIGNHVLDVLIRVRNLSRKEAVREALAILQAVGISAPEQRMKQYPHEFSGGMRQRVLIAMAIACQSELLIADEPTTALDVTIQAQIVALIKKLQIERELTVVLITHDLGLVAGLCSRIVVMYAGEVMEEGTTEEIFYHPKHPYTKALLASIPRLDEGEHHRLQAIRGNAPSAGQIPHGCPFADRCDYAFDRCGEAPPFVSFSETQRSKCWVAEKVGADA